MTAPVSLTAYIEFWKRWALASALASLTPKERTE